MAKQTNQQKQKNPVDQVLEIFSAMPMSQRLDVIQKVFQHTVKESAITEFNLEKQRIEATGNTQKALSIGQSVREIVEQTFKALEKL